MSIAINIGTTFDARDLQRAQKELDALKKNADTLSNRMTAVGSSFEKVGGQMAGVGKSLTAKVTAPILGLGTAAVAAFSTVEQGIAEVGKATGASGQDLERFGQNLRNVLQRVPEDARTVGLAMGDLNTRVGATGKQLETLTKQSLEFARVNNADVGESVTVLGKLLNALELDASDAESIMDKLTLAAQKTGISATKLGQNILDAGPAFEELGFGLDKSIALFAGFEAAGARPEEVIGSLNLAINRMAKEAGKLDELERGLIKPAEMFDELLQSIKDAPDILAATTLASELFGSRVGAKVAEDIRAGRFEVDAFAAEIAAASGVVSGTAEATETFADRMAILKNETLLVASSFGETLLPFIEQGVEKFRELTARFQNLSPEQREQIVRWAALIAAIGPAILIVGKIVAAIGTLIKAAVAVGKVIALLATPFGLVALAIAAVIAIGVLLWRNWETVQDAAGRLWDRVKEVFAGIRETIGTAVTAAKNVFSSASEGMRRAFEVIAGPIRIVGDGIASVMDRIRSLADGIKTAFTSMRNAAIDSFTAVGNAFATMFQRMTAAARPVAQLIVGLMNRIIDGVESAINALISGLNAVPRISIPNWVPVFGGSTFGLPFVSPVRFPRVPMLADGGIVDRATLAVVGEAGPEAVIPLDRLGSMSGQTTINVTVTSADPEAVVEAIRRYTRSNGPLGQVVRV